MKLAIVGATGVTGKYVLVEAERQGLSPIVVGRDSAGLRRLIAAHRLSGDQVRIADACDAPMLRNAFSGVSHVISTVAPFSANGFEIVRVAAQLGLGYTDSAGETGFIRRIADELDHIALKSGATLCTGNGVAAFLGDIATRWIAPTGKATGEATGEATILYHISGYRPSAGSLESYLSNILPEGGAAVRDGKVVQFPLGAFGGAVAGESGIHGIFPDALVISRYWRAKRIDVLMKSPPAARRFIRAAAALAASQYARKSLLALPWRRWVSSSENDDARSHCAVRVETIDESGHRASRSVEVDQIYLGTARVMLATINAMANRKSRPIGVRAASEMFSDFAESLALSGVRETFIAG